MKPSCVIGKYCEEHNFVHGAEAEELRQAIERFRDSLVDGQDIDDIFGGIQKVLDTVDARDSLAFVEVKPRKWKPENERAVRRRGKPKEDPRQVLWGSIWRHPKYGEQRVLHRLALAVGYCEMGKKAGCWSIENLRAEWTWVRDPTPAEVRAAEYREEP